MVYINYYINKFEYKLYIFDNGIGLNILVRKVKVYVVFVCVIC